MWGSLIEIFTFNEKIGGNNVVPKACEKQGKLFKNKLKYVRWNRIINQKNLSKVGWLIQIK